MAYIYPTKIQTTTGHSIKYATQKITNPSNLCSDSKALAYWGVKNPTYVGDYMRNYYDSVTTISGSYYKPETIYATLWDVGNIPNNATVNSITVEYKWEQVSYSCGTWDCYGRFERPTISFISDGKTIASFKGAKPEAIRYHNNKTNESKMNTNSANLSTLHSHTFKIPSKYNLTIKDLKKAKIKFDPAKNTYSEYCRIIMQFIRIKIDYTKQEQITQATPLPNYRIHNISVSPQSPTIDCESSSVEYYYKCTIRSTVPYVKNTTCTIIPSNDVEIIEYPSNYNKDTKIWTVSNFTNYQATIKLKCRSTKSGTKKIKTTINKYADSIQNVDERVFTVNKIENTLDWDVELDGEIKPYIYNGQTPNLKKCLKINIDRGCNQNNRHENVVIDTDGWITDENYWQVWNSDGDQNYTITNLNNGKWKISNLKGHHIIITTRNVNSCAPLPSGEYHVTVTHEEDSRINETKSIDIYVTNAELPMDYFKLRLEDGSDIKYNSLIFSLGDDLQFPLTYEPIEDDFIDNIQIDGETKHIPTNEAKYITYTLKSKETIENALCKIDVIGNRYVESNEETIDENASDIIIGADNQVQILEGGTDKFCVIDKLVADEEKKIKFVVQSDIEQECTFKLKFLNYDEYASEKWTPCKIIFKDMPNVKISIDTNKDDLTTPDNNIVEVYYNIENKSNVDGKNVKFQLREPPSFKIQDFTNNNLSVKYALYSENGEPLEQQPFFNEHNRIITFPILPGQRYDDVMEEYITQKQVLKIVYKATQKGIYDLILNTYDDKSTFEDDQWTNSVTKKIMVDISSNIHIKTSVNKPKPYLNELIDFKISAKNFTKKQKESIFIVKDIGSYNQFHSKNDYNIEYAKFNKGMFVDGSAPAKISLTSDNNIVQTNDEIKIKATLINAKGNPIPNKEIKLYDDWQVPSELLLETDKDIIQKDEDLTIEATVLGDRQGTIPGEVVNLYEGDGEIIAEVEEENDKNIIGVWTVQDIDVDEEFELVLTLRPEELGYHVIETTFIDDDGQIQTFTNIVNVFEPNKQISFNVHHAVGTNENIECNDFDNIIEICDDDYIDLGDTLFYVCEITNNNRNTITDTTHIYARLNDTFLTNDIICSTHKITKQENNLLHIYIPSIQGCQTVKICFKVKPSEIGTFISNFMLTNRNAKVYHKNLTINVSKNFDQKQLEHEITVYNFEKTNHYFRYELDGDNTIFKFFNQGNDKSLKMVDIENYKQDSIETYKGSNLKKVLRDITNNSKYIEPELLRVGSNKLAPKGYEMYPDGFIRRFGLLNSEVFHYTGQLPTIGYLADKAMKWDIDKWDTKVWGGDIYDNGVFDLTIDYSKIPTNFDILEIDDPIKNLQALVDKTKPYGTQAICYYSAKLYLDMKIDARLHSFEASSDLNLPLKISDIGLISLYNRHDNSIAAFYDLFNINLKTDIDLYEDVELSLEKDKDTKELKTKPYNNLSMKTDMMLIAEVFDQQYSKKYINECFDIVNMLYSYNPNITNIDIIKDYNYQPTNLRQNFTPTPNDIFSFEYNNDETLSIITSNNKYDIKYINDDEEYFSGFKIYENDKEIFITNFYTNINTYNIQVQVCEIPNINDKYVVHIFCSINNQSYVHIGYIIINIIDNISIQPNEYTSYSYTTTDQKVKFRISDVIKTVKEKPKTIVQFDKKWKWNGLQNIDASNKYAIIENNIDIDKECDITSIKAPTLALKYNNINISDYDEIVDIGVKLQAKTNKQNFIDDLKINMYTNGDYYIPEENIARKTYYPQTVNNINADYANTIIIEQPNITICSNCLHTNVGFFDSCPDCGSSKVSQYDEKKAVTICENPECGWIVDGWNDYCTHCLSEDVEKTKVDYNRTQCLNPGCNHIANDYYERCPKCFTTKVIHTNKNENKYTIGGNESPNIDKITIHSDVSRVNLCNIEINAEDIRKIKSSLKYLKLHLYGHDYNDGNFYYCSECKKIGLGNVKKCPYCNNTTIVNYTKYNNVAIYVYYQIGDKIKEVQVNPTYDSANNTFDIPIDILSLTDATNQSSFKLLIYAENLSYDDANTFVEKHEMDDDSYELFVNNIPIMNITLDNIYYEHQYVGEQDWQDIDNLETIAHTGINYKAQNKAYTDYIRFSDFNIENEKFDHAYLNVAGVNKANQHIDMEIITNGDETNKYIVQGIQPNLFSEQIDLLEITNTNKIDDITIQLCFTNVQPQSEITLTHIYITTEKTQHKNILYGSTKQHKYNVVQNNDVYAINTYNIFGLKNEHPYYIDGKLLDTNIVCYLDFGQLHNQEYIRLYNAELIILYKNKYGKMITEHINIDNEQHTRQLANANMQTNDAEIWGSIKTSMSTLNNLESHIFTNIDEESLQTTSLKYALSQAFTIITPNISQLKLNYGGSAGYPSDTITVQIFDDYHNKPDNLLFSKDVVMPNSKEEINIDIDIDNLPLGQYWFKLIDQQADKNNYHKFNHNQNVSVGNLIIHQNENNYQYDENKVLSFEINSNVDIRQYYDTPTTLDLDGATDFKTCYTLYRYNTKSINNAYIQDIQNETGYLQYADDVDIEVENNVTVESEYEYDTDDTDS